MNARMKADPGERQREIAKAKAVPRKACERLEKIKKDFPKLHRSAAAGDDMGTFGDL